MGPDLNLYWGLIVCVLLATAIIASFFGYYLFQKLNKEPALLAPAGGASSQIETVKKERIDKVLEYFSERKNKSSQILNSPAPVVDPSL